MTDVEELRVRIARAVDPETWNGIDKMEAIGRDAPFLRAKSEGSLTAADRVTEVLIEVGLVSLVAEVKASDTVAPAAFLDDEQDRPWRWRNLRAASLQIGICWPPRFVVQVDRDVYGFNLAIAAGLVTIVIGGGIGNCSSERSWERIGALSETEAWERASR